MNKKLLIVILSIFSLLLLFFCFISVCLLSIFGSFLLLVVKDVKTTDSDYISRISNSMNLDISKDIQNLKGEIIIYGFLDEGYFEYDNVNAIEYSNKLLNHKNFIEQDSYNSQFKKVSCGELVKNARFDGKYKNDDICLEGIYFPYSHKVQIITSENKTKHLFQQIRD